MFIEKDCTIELEGKKFESGGAFIAECSDGYLRGVVYQNVNNGMVSDWHGNKIAPATYGKAYQGNFCKMQSVRFEYEGRIFTGRYCPDRADMISVRSTKKGEGK